MLTPRRWPVVAGALLSLTILGACGTSTGDAEQAIADQSRGRLTEPECDAFGSDAVSGEETYLCSAAEPGGRRIKLMVTFAGQGNGSFILEWPCVSARVRWKAIRNHPALRCGRPLRHGSS